jgi:hypothetical protein
VFAQLLHVRSHEHLTELDKVTVLLVVDLHDAPWVSAPADLAAVQSADEVVRADDGEWYFARNLLHLRNGLLILVFVLRRLENVDVVVSNVGENLHRRHENNVRGDDMTILTRALNSWISSSVMVSAFAIMGMRLTLSWS